MKIINIIL